MAAWNIPLQIAAYKGVTFDVISIDESNEKSLIEHAYPHVDGVDLEDMGLGSHTINMSAIYWSYGFDAKVKNLLATLAQKDGGVLVHPVMGRVPDMVVASYNVRYQADDVNYVAIDMSFRKNTVGNPIFVSSNSLICLIDSAFASLNNFISEVNNILSQTIAVVLLMRQQINAFDFAVSATIDSIKAAFDGLFYNTYETTHEHPQTSPDNTTNTVTQMCHTVISTALRMSENSHMQVRGVFAGSAGINEKVGSIAVINQSVDSALDSLPLNVDRFLSQDIKNMIRLSVALSCTSLITRAAVETLEFDNDITPPEVMKILSVVRSQIQQSINTCNSQPLLTADARYSSISLLRELAKMMNEIAESAVNRKPPLLVKHVQNISSAHELAHQYYADYTRADELIRLNPHIRHPTFINKGDYINAYAQ
ncbi:MAG: DNA circularization N-terminal domain-containing protein [Gammaproteobacteria bacterium]|nr:DNA circularization N-terminal domain-containing protein [Gammaproteobacteria bacterium]